MRKKENSYFQKRYQSQVIPYFNKKGVAGHFTGKGKVRLTYRKFLATGPQSKWQRCALIILPGRAEPIQKYAEIIYDLGGLGCSIYIMEHRGQGESSRVDGCPIQYVENFADYVEDLDTFIKKVVNQRGHTKLLLLAHSMGGAIGTLYVSQHPGVFHAMALSAPMFDINTRGLPKFLAHGIAQFLCRLGLGKFSEPTGAGEARVTSSRARRQLNQRVTLQFSCIHPQKISFRWLKASLEALRVIQNQASSISIPVLLLQAGRDLLVPAKGQNDFCRKVSQTKKYLFPKGYHELLMERACIRNEVLEKIRTFFLNQIRSRG